jgi:UDP-glucose:(heptosyl)LPS alpha-1,3-glucosyltransferase
MKKIYFIRANKNSYGGAENYLCRLSRKLETKGVEYKIINSPFPKILPSWLRVVLFNLYLLIIKRDKFYFSLERISNPDIYRAGDGVHKVFLRNVNKSMLNPLHEVFLYYEKKCFENSKKIIVNSQMIKKQIIETYGVKEEKISLVYNGFDAENLNYSDSFDRISKEFLITKEDVIFLYVGSGFHRKGVERFLKILSRLDKKNYKAFVVGKEKNLNYYKNLAKNFSIKDRVFFTGPRKNVNDFYNISDFFIFPTKYEPFGNVVLEAMSYGNVVFTTKSNGASEIINPEFIMDSLNDNPVLKKINKILDDKVLMSKIKLRNLQKSRKYSCVKNANETLKVINELIN